jgi:hypothetical protein
MPERARSDPERLGDVNHQEESKNRLQREIMKSKTSKPIAEVERKSDIRDFGAQSATHFAVVATELATPRDGSKTFVHSKDAKPSENFLAE